MAQVTLRDYLQEIEDAISLERVDDALTRCQHVLVQFPESLEAQRLLGEVYLAQGQIADAQQSLDWVLTNDPENVIAYCDRALICERLSDFDTALDCYQQAYELSRGNSQIRQEFNILSTKTGQQGFMFSRAGLARLYMRGGLLPQAVQEWEAVLVVSPDRLDARTGLLEAYWREGLYDRAEQLANQILHDLPDCLKALLLLAHLTAPRDMQQAQELIQRAEMLDPDFLMAQELFEDMMASQPRHPFLKLLKKAPVVLDDDDDAAAVLSSIPTSEEPIIAPASLLHEASASSSLFSNWSGLENWNGVDTLIKPRPDEQPLSEAPALSSWSSDTFASPGDDSWEVLEKQQEPYPQEDSSPTIHHQGSFQPEAWSQDTAEEGAVASSQSNTHVQSELDHLAELNVESANNWNSTQDNDALDSANAWISPSQEETLASPPVWLSMLTQEEQSNQRQPDNAMSSMQGEQQFSTSSTAQQRVDSEPVVSAEESSSQAHGVVSSNGADEEAFFFGPEWLKSLGAATIDSSSQEERAMTASVPPVEANTTPTTLSATVESESSAFETDAWSDYMSTQPQQSEQGEQNLITTLEDLEQDLRSQGFIPLEPNSLSTIAQAQETTSSIHPTEDEPVQQVEETYGGNAQQEVTLSSALAEPNFTAPSASDANVSPALSTPSSQEAADAVVPRLEPLWASELRTVPAAPSIEEEQPVVSPASFEEPVNLISSPPPVQTSSVLQEQSTMPLTRIEAISEPVFEPTPIPEVAPEAEPKKVPVARTDAFYDSELETTMKRPAVRLQPIQQRTASQQPLPSSVARGRGEEPRSASGGGKDNFQSYQERLIKGYQHQLVGDYDEAMQEYRIIIRSAPELLAEVISNVRALLKLAPMYSAGYRVLGDAYMRQGEYLQAMEAYNKALTMAKKAKV